MHSWEQLKVSWKVLPFPPPHLTLCKSRRPFLNGRVPPRLGFIRPFLSRRSRLNHEPRITKETFFYERIQRCRNGRDFPRAINKGATVGDDVIVTAGTACRTSLSRNRQQSEDTTWSRRRERARVKAGLSSQSMPRRLGTRCQYVLCNCRLGFFGFVILRLVVLQI